MRPKQIWWVGVGVIAIVWAVAGSAIWAINSRLMTMDKVLDYFAANPLEEGDESARARVIEGLAERVNQLPFEERQKVRGEKVARDFYEEMTEAERAHFLQLTAQESVRQLRAAFDRMTPQQRKRLVDHAVRDLSELRGEGAQDELKRNLPDQRLREMIGQGLQGQLKEAGTASTLDMQSLMEQMQHILRQPHG